MPINSGFYITSGIVPADGPSYVTREADAQLLELLVQGEFCYVLTSRQMGKSSLMSQMVRRLRQRGAIAVVLDLSSQGFQLSTEQWYNGLLYQLGRRLKLDSEVENFRLSHPMLSPLQLWQRTLRDVVLESCDSKVTVFIDEIDVARSLPFSADEFFAAVRSCYNARTEDPAFSRLNFCLLGVATPSDLISNPALTPFNIGKRIELSDFTRDEASILENGLGKSVGINSALMDRIHYWTGGHPYLTQRLCEAVSEDDSKVTHRDVDACVARLFLSAYARRQDSNLLFVRQRMVTTDDERSASQLTLYSRIVGGAAVEDNDTVPFVAALKLAGIVRGAKGRLRVRNRIYGIVFDKSWGTNNMPDAEQRRQRMAYRKGFVRAGAAASIIMAVMGGLILFTFLAQQRANMYRLRADNATAAAHQRLQEAKRASYALTMNLIQREWDQNNIDHVLEMLEATKSSEFRGFEWGYWNHLCHLDLMTLRGHTKAITSVAFSPDGKHIATGCRDATVKLWDAQTGRQMLTFSAWPTDYLDGMAGVTSIAYSPNGKQIVTACEFTISTWSAATGKCLWTSGLRTTGLLASGLSPSGWSIAFVTCAAISADGKRIAAGMGNYELRDEGGGDLRPFLGGSSTINDPHKTANVVKEWDAVTGCELLTMPGHTDGIKSIAFSSDGTRIASGSYDRTTRIWDARTGEQKLIIKDPTKVITSIAFSPDGKRIVTAFKRVFQPDNGSAAEETPNDSTVKIWDAFTGREMVRLKGYTSTVRSVVFSPDGKRIATAGNDNTARIWDAATGREQIALRGHTGYVNALAFSLDGTRLVTGSSDDTAKIWDCAASHEALVLPEHGARVTAVAVSKDGKLIATGSGNAAATWDPATGRENISYPDRPSDSTDQLAGNTVELRNAVSGKVVFPLTGHKGDVTSVAFSPDSRRIVSGSYDGTAKVWSTKTGRELSTLVAHAGVVTSAAFSPDGCRIITGSLDKSAKIWDAATGREVLTLRGNTGPISSVAVSPDGKRIVTGSSDKTAKLWDASSGRQMLSFNGHTDEVLAVAFSPDGCSIVTGSADNTAIVWNAATGTQRCTLRGHLDNVNSVAFSPDGKRIVTGSDDHTAKVWDAETGQELLTLKGHTRAIHGVCFSPDGRDVITGSWDKTTRVWRAVFDGNLQ